MRKACGTELQVFCSESLRARGIIDFPKSQFIPTLCGEEKSVFAQNQGCYIMKTSVKEEVKRSITQMLHSPTDHPLCAQNEREFPQKT